MKLTITALGSLDPSRIGREEDKQTLEILCAMQNSPNKGISLLGKRLLEEFKERDFSIYTIEEHLAGVITILFTPDYALDVPCLGQAVAVRRAYCTKSGEECTTTGWLAVDYKI